MRLAGYLHDTALVYRLNFQPLPLPARLSAMLRMARMHYSGSYSAPHSILIGVTGNCQCRCAHCGISYLHKDAELSLETVQGLLNEYRQMGGIRVIFSGGEPLLHGDLVAMVRHAARLGLTTFVDSNGLALTDALARQLAGAGLCVMELSIDFLDGEKMAENRGCPDVLDRVKAAIKTCKRAGLSFSINTVAFRENLDGGVQEIIRYARQVGARCVRVLEPISVGNMQGRSCTLNPAERQRYLALHEPGYVILEQVGKFTSDCSGLNGRFLSIGPDGTVEPCPYMPLPLGNIHEQTLLEIMHSMQGKIRKINRTACNCEAGCPVNDPEFQRAHLQADS